MLHSVEQKRLQHGRGTGKGLEDCRKASIGVWGSAESWGRDSGHGCHCSHSCQWSLLFSLFSLTALLVVVVMAVVDCGGIVVAVRLVVVAVRLVVVVVLVDAGGGHCCH